MRGNYQISLELAKQLLPLAQGQQDPTLLIEACHALGENLYLSGELTSARAHLERGIALYDPQQRHSLGPGAVPYVSAVVSCLAFVAFVQWLLGYPDQALKRIHEARPLVQKLALPFSLAYVSVLTAFVHQTRQEVQAALEEAEARANA